MRVRRELFRRRPSALLGVREGRMTALKRLTSLAYHRWGRSPQLDMVAEECAELIAALNRAKRGREHGREDVAEEAADVYITLETVRLWLGDEAVDDAIERKLARLESKLNLDNPEA